MKIKYLITAVCLLFLTSAFSQRFCYVDTEYILDKVPDYKSAQKTLDNQSDVWKKEIEKMSKEIEALYKQYQAEQVLLPEESEKEKRR